ncbi:MAG: PKD domain-containing protein [Candidatus Peribacteraceae bacterium]|nr:PKD domain-containing protein [Candidatus Peribacteraceae bacterium]
MDNQNLSDFDEVAAPKSSEETIGSMADESKDKPAHKPLNGRKMAFGCLFLFLSVFLILLLAMAFGLNAKEETILSLGLNPVSLKNWSIGMVNFLFGAIALTSIIILVSSLARRLLSKQDDRVGKSQASKRSFASLAIFAVTIGLWFVTYDYFSQFEMKEPELPIEIITKPTDTLNLTSPIRVEFSAERITAKFEGDGKYDVISYEWDKESDGGVDATGPKVTIYFVDGGKNNGVFNVNLLVKLKPKSGGEIETREYQKEVSIPNQEIYGEITTDKSSGEAPLTVRFDASNIQDPSLAKITNFSWDLDGDGRPDRDGSSYGTTEWTFETIGEHTVTLTVTSEDFNADGTHETKTFEKKITVREAAGTVKSEVWIEATPQRGFSPLSVTLIANQKSVDTQLPRIDKYEWRIGDGLATLWGQRTRYTFEKPGNYPVLLVVTFANGQTSEATEEIIVNDESFTPTAKINTDPEINRSKKAVTGPAPLSVEFDATSSVDPDDNIVKYEWDFDGDGLWDDEGSSTTYEFRDAGEYESVLRVTDADGNESRSEITISVDEENAIVNFGADKLSGAAPVTVNFDASGSRVPTGKKIISYEWNFDLENRAQKQNFIYERAQTSHIFETVGEYIVELTLHTDDGGEYSDSIKIVASYASLSANFSMSRTSGNAPLAVSFDATASSGNVDRVEWDFDDGSASTIEKPTHVFENPGKYEIILKVYDAFGNVSQTSKNVTVN